MSDASAVRSAWLTGVWSNSTITALTTKIYAYDAVELAALSTAHEAKLLYNQQYHFIQYRVAKTRAFQMTGKMVHTYPVIVQYFKQADIDGAAYNAIEDAFETIFDTVQSGLDTTWSGTVDFYRTQESAAEILVYTINDVPCWFGQYTFTGYKEVTL